MERYWQIQAHVAEDFWAIKCFHKAEDGSAEFTWAYVFHFPFGCYPFCSQPQEYMNGAMSDVNSYLIDGEA